MPFFIDSHAHLGDEEILKALSFVMKNASKENISNILNICTNKKDFEEGEKITSAYPNVALAAAIPPQDVEKTDSEELFIFFEKITLEKKIVAIGETGLDYYYGKKSKELQIEFLLRFIHLANRTHLPIIFHCRDAFLDLFSLVDQSLDPKIPAIFHCFTGNENEVKEALSRNFWISFSGIITFSKAQNLQKIVQEVPLEKMLLESDAPYLAPEPYRGKRNEPSYIVETAKQIAKLKKITLEEVALLTSSNAKKLFFSKSP